MNTVIRGVGRSMVAALVGMMLLVVATTTVSMAQPTGADATYVLEDWAFQASMGEVLSDTYNLADMALGSTWYQMYVPNSAFYEGTATAPYKDDLKRVSGYWVTSVYSLGVIAGAVQARDGVPWVAGNYYPSDTGQAIASMTASDKFLEVPLAQGQWIVHADESVTPAGYRAYDITPAGGTLADIYNWVQGQAVQDPDLVGGGGSGSIGTLGGSEERRDFGRMAIPLLVVIGVVVVVGWRRML